MKRLLFLPLLATMIAIHAQNIKEGETLQEVTVKGLSWKMDADCICG